jgi:uncharacterized protein (TIGR02147 family)
VVSPFDYFDYRELLGALYREKKKESRHVSYRYIARRVGFSSPSFFPRVIKGELDIATQTALGLARIFGLSRQETRYFETLVQYNQAQGHDDKRYYFEKLMSDRRTSVRSLTREQYEIFSQWYHIAIREALAYLVVSDNFAELARHLNPEITEAQARKAIRTLEALGFVRKGPDGTYERADAAISTGENWNSLAVANFQRSTNALAREALDTVPVDKRNVSTLTMSVSERSYEMMVNKIKVFRSELLEIAKSDPDPDRVYHLNVAFFPMTRDKGSR